MNGGGLKDERHDGREEGTTKALEDEFILVLPSLIGRVGFSLMSFVMISGGQ